MEQNIIIAIKSKIEDEKLPVTYSWLQRKFNISPKESQIYLEKFMTMNCNAVPTYISYATNDNTNHNFTISTVPSKNGFIISLKLNTEQIVGIKSFDSVSIDSKLNNYAITCEEAKLLSRSNLSTNEPDNCVQSANVKPTAASSIKTEPKSFFNTNPVRKNSSSENNSRNDSFGNNSKISHNVTKKPLIDKSSKGNVDAFQSFKTQVRIKENASTVSKPSTIKSISPQKTTPNEIVCTDQHSDNSDSDDQITQQKPQETESSFESKNMSIKSSKSEKISTKSKLFDNFENESESQTRKRKRLVIESDDENDIILANDSFEQPKKSSSNKSSSNPSKKPKTIKAAEKIKTETRVDNSKIISKENIQQHPVSMKKVDKTYQDDEGFLVFEKVLVPVNGCDKLINEPMKADSTPPSPPPKAVKPERKISKNSKLNSNSKQTNILSFFQKK